MVSQKKRQEIITEKLGKPGDQIQSTKAGRLLARPGDFKALHSTNFFKKGGKLKNTSKKNSDIQKKIQKLE